MKGWLIYGRKEADCNRGYINLYMEECRKRQIQLDLLFVDLLDFGVRDGRPYISYEGKEERPDFAICRCIYPLLSRHLEEMGVPVFNRAGIAEICNDKARTYLYVSRTGVPMVDSRFCKRDYVEDIASGYPADTVLKSVDGHGGGQVFDLREGFTDTMRECFIKSDGVLQPLTGTRHQDLRVYVIGRDIIAAVLRTAAAGFKSNYSLGGRVELYELSEKEKEPVNRIIGLFGGFGLVGIDFIIGDEGQLIFNEIEDVVGARMLYQCSDINIVPLYLDWILGELKECAK
ncbi:ATP-grasp domain-containing protein [Anaerolentibacter hominis]|uniref:ATP-grasp domain-containing protein n=1 Tax=Anaerolentibacter hominis TaxID=3079009 RepID=UPI0031B88AA3